MNVCAVNALHGFKSRRAVDLGSDPSDCPTRIKSMPVLGASTVACIALVLASANSFAQVATSIGPFGYQNQLYNPAAGPIPGLTQSPQPKGVAIFGGNVGAFGQPATPNDGTFYLVQSGFGQPVAEARQPDFLIGEEIIPDPALQVDMTKPPVINPQVKAFYLA